jgi:CheY-like chemotaxis protein
VDGEQALQLLRARDPGNPVQLVLTDVIMPVMGGRELSERLSAMPLPPRVMFMSGYTEESIARHGILEQSVHFIQKPFDIRSLLLKVRESLDAS